MNKLQFLHLEKLIIKWKASLSSGKDSRSLVRIQEKMIQETPSQEESYSIGLPIPGFEVDVVRPKAESRPLTESNPVSPRTGTA